MDDEQEMIRHQMEVTRASLSEKLETLEHQVVDTVQDATDAVTDTVESVREAVQGTVDSVKESVEGTVETVKSAFDLKSHTERYPWAVMGGAVAVGYLGGWLLGKTRRDHPSDRAIAPAHYEPPAPSEERWERGGARYAVPSARLATEERKDEQEPSQPGMLSRLTETFGSELAKMKGLAVGTMLGLVRDMVTKSVPPQIQAQVTDVINSITTKLGGETIQGPILEDDDANGRRAGYGASPERGTASEPAAAGAWRR